MDKAVKEDIRCAVRNYSREHEHYALREIAADDDEDAVRFEAKIDKICPISITKSDGSNDGSGCLRLTVENVDKVGDTSDCRNLLVHGLISSATKTHKDGREFSEIALQSLLASVSLNHPRDTKDVKAYAFLAVNGMTRVARVELDHRDGEVRVGNWIYLPDEPGPFPAKSFTHALGGCLCAASLVRQIGRQIEQLLAPAQNRRLDELEGELAELSRRLALGAPNNGVIRV